MDLIKEIFALASASISLNGLDDVENPQQQALFIQDRRFVVKPSGDVIQIEVSPLGASPITYSFTPTSAKACRDGVERAPNQAELEALYNVTLLF